MEKKKIKFIKENDLFDWEVGDEAIVNENGAISWVGDDYCTWIHVENLVKLGYAEWVSEEKIVEDLVERIDKHIGFLEGLEWGDYIKDEWSEELYTYAYVRAIVDMLNEEWKPDWGDVNEDKYFITHCRAYRIRCMVHENLSTPCVKTEDMAKAIIKSKRLRPHLDKLYDVEDNE